MINATDEDKEALAEIQKDKSKTKMDRNQRINNYEPETFETHQNFEFHENHENKTEESSNNNENFDNQADQSENRTGVSKPESVMTESRNENVSFPTVPTLVGPFGRSLFLCPIRRFRPNLNCILGCFNSEFKCLFSGNDSSRYTIHSSYTFYNFILEFIFLLNSSNNIFPISLPARQYPGLSIGKVSSYFYRCSTSVVLV